MKKITYAIALFILASSFTIIYDASKDVVGKWKTAESSYPAARKALIERVRKISPDQADQLEAAGEQLDQLIAMITIEYKASGEFEIATPQGPQTGKWKITGDGKYLERQADGGTAVRKDSIVELKPTKMVLISLESKDKDQIEYVKAE